MDRIWKAGVALVAGAVSGAAIWAGLQLVLHGVCSVPVVKTLWCTLTPAGTVGSKVSWLDVLELPIFMGVMIFAFYKRLVLGEWPWD